MKNNIPNAHVDLDVAEAEDLLDQAFPATEWGYVRPLRGSEETDGGRYCYGLFASDGSPLLRAHTEIELRAMYTLQWENLEVTTALH